MNKAASTLRFVLLIACSNLSLPVNAQNFPQPESAKTCTDALQLATLSVDKKLNNFQILGYKTHAMETCNQELGDGHISTVASIGSLAETYSTLGENNRAIALLEKIIALDERRLSLDHPFRSFATDQLVRMYKEMEQFDKALKLNEKILASRQVQFGADHTFTVNSMSNLAQTQNVLGQYGKALVLQEKVLSINKRKLGGNHLDTLLSMVLLAQTYDVLGQHAKAIALNTNVLSASETTSELGYLPIMVIASNNIANSYSSLNQPYKALVYAEDVFRLYEKHLGPDHETTLGLMMNLIATYRELGQYDKAFKLGKKANELAEKKLNQNSLTRLGIMVNVAANYNAVGKHTEALSLQQKVLANLVEKFGENHPNTLDRIDNLATTLGELNQFEQALINIKQWLIGVESTRKIPALTVVNQQSNFTKYADRYKFWSAQYAQQNRKTEGFDLGDLSKARTLTDSLKAQSALRSLPEAQQSTLQTLQTRAQAQQKTMEQLLNSGNSNAERLQTQQQSIDAINAEYAALHTQLKAKYPKYAALTDLQPVTASQAPQLLGAGEVFISYLVRKTGQAQVFVLPPSGQVQWVDLKTIPNHVQTVAAYRELIAPSSKASEQGQLVALKEGGYQWVNAGAALPSNAQGTTPAAPNPAAALALLKKYWHDALIKPILPIAGPYARWIISPDKDLALLPFDTLPYTDPATAQTPSKPEQSLAQAKQTTLVQSFAVYALLKAREAEYAQLKRPKELFAMGNAVYNDKWQQANSVETVAVDTMRPIRKRQADVIEVVSNNATVNQGNSATQPLTLAAEQYSQTQLWWSNLPGTAREVQAVAQAFGVAGTSQAKGISTSQVDTYMGAQASEATLQQLNRDNKLKDYRYLLFSAHGYLAQNPALSALVLSQKGNPEGVDGYITAAEWPQYDVRSDLTVLSACDTGVGQTQSGEGVMGLPYALFVAGNKNTLLTLWPVDDDATAEFMSKFFAKLKAGEPQASALAKTKQEFMRHQHYSQPRYWAAFVLYGV